MSTISANGDTQSIYLQQSGADVQWSTDNATWSTVIWPATIGNIGSSTLEIIFTTDLELNSNNSYFICGSNKLQFGSRTLRSDGTRPTITIGSGATNYPGLIQNGTSTTEGHSYIYVINLNVHSNGAVLAPYGGWVAQEYFTTNFVLPDTVSIVNCSSDGTISDYGGGICGSYSTSFYFIRGCSSSGDISGTGAGGIVGGYTTGSLVIESSFSTGAISSGGGIVGSYSTSPSGFLARYCYSTGSIGNGAGGIVGRECAVTIESCYSTGSIAENGGGIYGENTYDIDSVNCYSLGTIASGAGGIVGNNPQFIFKINNCYTAGACTGGLGGIIAGVAESNPSPPEGEPIYAINNYSECIDGGTSGWNAAHASVTLQNVGDDWIELTAGSPYKLFKMGYSPYSLTNILADYTLNRTKSQTVTGATSASVLPAGYTYSIVQINSGSPSSYPTITIDSVTGVITEAGSAVGTYTILIYNEINPYNFSFITVTFEATPLRRTPITALAVAYGSLSLAVSTVAPTLSYVPQATFDEYSSINQLSFIPGYLSSIWPETYFGSTVYVSSLISPYAVIVGPGNVVGGQYTLTEGISNTNFGTNSFVGGSNSYGAGANVMAYGTGAWAISTNAAAFGSGAIAAMPNSIAYGTSTFTLVGSNQHVHGISNVADGTASHAEGWSTTAFSDFSHTEGLDTQIWGGSNSHAEGTDTLISTSIGVGLHVEGLSTFAYGGSASHAEGARTIADVGLAHAEGEATISLGSTSHTQGFLTVASTFMTMFGTEASNVVASNAHVEGMCNIAFMPNNHMQGISSLNVGWFNHVDGLGNRTSEVLGYMEGTCNMSESPIIYNNSTFIRSFSSIYSFLINNTSISFADISIGFIGFSNYVYSINNHIEGLNNYISSPTMYSHIEGRYHSTCTSFSHFEGAYNYIFLGRNQRTGNMTQGGMTHMEGYCNGIPLNLGVTGFTSAAHFEGLSNVSGAASVRWACGQHFEGIGNVTSGGGEVKPNHVEGSNSPGIMVMNTNSSTGGPIHKEGINNTTQLNTTQSGQHIVGENNTAGSGATIIGFFNLNPTTVNNWSYIIGKYNSNYLGMGSIAVGISNSHFANSFFNNVNLGNYGHVIQNGENGRFGYGSVALSHSTIRTLVRASAYSWNQNYISMTSSITTFQLLRYFNTNITSPASFNRQVIINYNSIINTVSYPTSNQINYINIYDMKVTGYQARRLDSSGGLGFYSGNYSFAIYRDNTQRSNLCLCDLVSLSTVSTMFVANPIAQVSTIIKPLFETNRLLNINAIDVRVTASNRVQPIGAQFYLDIRANGNITTNWMAQAKISQVIRP